MKKTEIDQIVQARLQDAKILYNAHRYDGSVYLCGYAVELGLKSRICLTLNWHEYPSSSRKYNSFKTHDLDILLHLSGVEDTVKAECFADWSIIAEWNPEARYRPIGTVSQSGAQDMLESTIEVLRVL